MVSQGLLFSEPSVAETGIWCALADGIDPAQWARLCRFIGTRNRRDFEHIFDTVMPAPQIGKKTYSESRTAAPIPLVSIGPSGLGGQFQNEHF